MLRSTRSRTSPLARVEGNKIIILDQVHFATDQDVIGAESVPLEIRGGTRAVVTVPAERRTFLELKAEAERQIIVYALERNDWHITKTAQELGLADHASLLKIMRRHNVTRD